MDQENFLKQMDRDTIAEEVHPYHRDLNEIGKWAFAFGAGILVSAPELPAFITLSAGMLMFLILLRYCQRKHPLSTLKTMRELQKARSEVRYTRELRDFDRALFAPGRLIREGALFFFGSTWLFGTFL